jgi:plastocyanin
MGASYQFQFNTAGTYHYECGIHGAAMSGRVVVR